MGFYPDPGDKALVLCAEGDTGLNMSTQYGSGFSLTSVNEDGYSSGCLRSMNVSDTGVINGQTWTIGQVALSPFIAETDLTKDVKNLSSQSSKSRPSIVNVANSLSLGMLQSSSLELSNEDQTQPKTYSF